MSKTFLFLKIQFSIGTQFSSIGPIDRTLSGSTSPCQSGPGSYGNEKVLHIPQRSSITGNSPSECLRLYSRHYLWGGLTSCRYAVGVFHSPSRLGKPKTEFVTWYVCMYVCMYHILLDWYSYAYLMLEYRWEK